MSLEMDAFSRLALSQLWQVTVVALAVGGLVRLFCRCRPHVAYVLWLVVIIKCLTPPVWSSPMGVFSWARARTVMPGLSPATTVPAALPRDSSPPVMPLVVPSERPEASWAASWRPCDQQVRVEMTEHAPPEPRKRAELAARIRLGHALAIVWLSGALVLTGVLLARWTIWTIVLWRSRVPTDDTVAGLVAAMSRRLGIKRRVHVLVTAQRFGPAVCGVLWPRLILPKMSLSECPPDDVERIVAHELIHIRRGDNSVGILQLVAQILWWFHPLIWWANRQISREREHCCDEEVVGSLNCDPGTYAQTLLHVLRSLREWPPAFLCSGVRSTEVTTGRMERIMDTRKAFHRSTPPACWAALAVSGLLVLPGAGLELPDSSADAKAEVPAGQAAVAGPSSADGRGNSKTIANSNERSGRRSRPLLVVGTPGYAADLDDGKEEATAAIHRLGGEVMADANSPNKDAIRVHLTGPRVTVTDADLVHLEGLANLEVLLLDNTEVTDAGLEHLRRLKRLRKLSLNGTQVTGVGLEHLNGVTTNLDTLRLENSNVTDTGLVHLNGLTSLTVLCLNDNEITDAGLVHLKEMTSLRVLDLKKTKVTDAGLVHLKGLTKLQWLDLDDTKVTDAGLGHLKALTDLSGLSLGGTQITDAGLVDLRDLTNLSWLHLENTRITGPGLEHLKKSANVGTLNVQNTKITDVGLEHLKELTKLWWLDLHNTQITDEGLERLKGLPELRGVELQGTKITDAGLEHLGEIPTLRRLLVHDTKVTDAGLEHLKGLANLKRLDLYNTEVTDEGVKNLQQALPNCRIRR